MSVWEEIVDYTVPSNTTSFTVNNFGTITKNDFIVIKTNFINTFGSDNNIAYIYPNSASTTTDYHVQQLFGRNSNAGAGRLNRLPIVNVARTAASGFGISYVKLSENDRFNLFTNYNFSNDSNINLDLSYTTSSGVTFSSGITSFTIVGERTNGFGTGSRIQIYKLAAEKVADITVASNTTQVDITGLNIDKGSEYLLVSDVSNSTSSFPGVNLFVNNNTTQSNYYNQTILGNGTSSAAVRGNHANFTDQTTLGPNVVYSHIKLSNIGAYTSQNYVIRGSGSSSLQLRNRFISSTFENITNITQLNIITGTTNAIATGSRFTLYKLY